MPAIAHTGPIDYQAIHFSERFPVVRTACGKLGPSAGRWRYVSCLACLDAAPDDPRSVERRRQARAEAELRGGGTKNSQP